MIYMRWLHTQLAWLLLSLAGIGVSIYLTLVHYSGASLVCSTSGLVNCERVLSSSFSLVPGTTLPISLPGLFWFLVSGTLAVLAWRTGETGISGLLRSLQVAEFAWAALGMLTVFYLVYAEIVKIQAICAWCTVVHILILSMFLIATVQLQRSASASEVEEEAEDVPSAVSVRE